MSLSCSLFIRAQQNSKIYVLYNTQGLFASMRFWRMMTEKMLDMEDKRAQ